MSITVGTAVGLRIDRDGKRLDAVEASVDRQMQRIDVGNGTFQLGLESWAFTFVTRDGFEMTERLRVRIGSRSILRVGWIGCDIICLATQISCDLIMGVGAWPSVQFLYSAASPVSQSTEPFTDRQVEVIVQGIQDFARTGDAPEVAWSNDLQRLVIRRTGKLRKQLTSSPARVDRIEITKFGDTTRTFLDVDIDESTEPLAIPNDPAPTTKAKQALEIAPLIHRRKITLLDD